ncbi:hypothetical protein [Candidatus Entotheonella palauensis]|uniref:hypothetical protein n=1 Tax=Candidatus Entotheonella palauensis TaxID=93172 RepID=UPI000B7E09DE|nr:hypothetical protein [Candidatus Entotheonella palauensis]
MKLTQRGTILWIIALCLILLGPALALAQGRTLLYPANADELSAELREIVDKIIDPSTKKVWLDDMAPGKYFARLTEKRFIISSDGTRNDGAVLGSKPFVFITVPQTFYVRQLFEAYSSLGYGVENVLANSRKQQALMVFRYPDEIQLSPVKNGQIPDENFRSHIYVPVWPNVFPLFTRLSRDAVIASGGFHPYDVIFANQREKMFAISFPRAGRRRIANASYTELEAVGGADFVYRGFLDAKMSMNDHFLGTGQTKNTVLGGEGVLEFIGPNLRVFTPYSDDRHNIPALAEVAVIDMGAIVTYVQTFNGGQQ